MVDELRFSYVFLGLWNLDLRLCTDWSHCSLPIRSTQKRNSSPDSWDYISLLMHLKKKKTLTWMAYFVTSHGTVSVRTLHGAPWFWGGFRIVRDFVLFPCAEPSSPLQVAKQAPQFVQAFNWQFTGQSIVWFSLWTLPKVQSCPLNFFSEAIIRMRFLKIVALERVPLHTGWASHSVHSVRTQSTGHSELSVHVCQVKMRVKRKNTEEWSLNVVHGEARKVED